MSVSFIRNTDFKLNATKLKCVTANFLKEEVNTSREKRKEHGKPLKNFVNLGQL